MRVRNAAVVIVFAVLAVATVAGTASGAGNTPPLADAGLDQRVTPNTTVYLDANESRDPDGEVASVAWTVESPDGDTFTPDCGSCRQTEFDVDDTGQYNVTLAVTDDDGATRSDTLYVTAAASEGPSVSVSGPAVTDRDSETEFTATVESPETELQSLAWVVDGDVVDQRDLNGTNATVSGTHSFNDTGDTSIRAVAYDTLGHRGADERPVTVGKVVNDGSNSGGKCSGDTGGPVWDGNKNFEGCYDGEDRLITADGETYVQDVNSEDGIQLYDDAGNLVDLGDVRNNENINSDGKLVGGYEQGDDMVAHVAAGNDEVTVPNGSPEPSADNDGGGGSDGSLTHNDYGNSHADSGANARALDGSTTSNDNSDDTDQGATSSADLAGTISSDSSDSGGNDDSGGMLGGLFGSSGDDSGGDSGGSDDSDSGGFLSGLI